MGAQDLICMLQRKHDHLFLLFIFLLLYLNHTFHIKICPALLRDIKKIFKITLKKRPAGIRWETTSLFLSRSLLFKEKIMTANILKNHWNHTCPSPLKVNWRAPSLLFCFGVCSASVMTYWKTFYGFHHFVGQGLFYFFTQQDKPLCEIESQT